MSRFAAFALAGLLPLLLVDAPGRAQDSQDDLRSEIEKVVRKRFEELRKQIEKILDEELARATRPPAPSGATRPAVGDVTPVLEKITEESIRKIVSHLASDELEGRGAGYPGNDKATEYIAGIYKAAGLKPVGDKDEASGEPTYFQHFNAPNRRKTRNTVAFLEGSDLKDEIVVIGGHHDHLGKGSQAPFGQALGRPQGDDDIWNGADDNGSGSSTVVAIAKAFGESGVKPRRSILFMTFSAEEWGLVGSRHYCSNPIFPLAKTVAMINMDMVGRNADRPVKIQGLATDEGDLFDRIARKAVEATGLNAEFVGTPSVGGGDSDHSSFIARGVPAMFFFTGLHGDYHRVTDHVDKLAIDNMAKIGKTAAFMLWELATGDAKAGAAQGGRRGGDFRFPPDRPGGGGDQPRRLGVVPDSSFDETDMEKLGLPAGEGGIQASSVSGDSVAATAGVKEGDVIVRFAGEPFKRPVSAALQQLRERLAKVKAGEDVEIVVIREGERVTLKAKWE
ncbi:MAG TPA: M20/M25/M40 family metallo-hydrolase [Planctomycetota bacterium]|nr:M20/M25/M40 family metallo-hydrolase [Planctomycetota bacterium]